MSIKYSTRGSQMCFEPFGFKLRDLKDVDPVTKENGIRFHNSISALVLKIFSLFGLTSGIVQFNYSGDTIYLNKGSFKKWCLRHQNPFIEGENILNKINNICLSALNQKEHQEKQQHQRVQAVALKHLNILTKEVYNLDGELKTNFCSYLGKKTVFSKDPHDPNSFSKVFKTYHFKDNSLTLYHGTSSKNAKIIKQDGFDPLAVSKTGTDTGAGSYLTVEKDIALSYARNQQDGLLTCKLKPGIRIVEVGNSGYNDYIHSVFKTIVSGYVESKQTEIKADLGELSKMEFDGRLWDLFVRDFFLRSHVDGVFVENSSIAGCSYFNLFDPQRDILEIK